VDGKGIPTWLKGTFFRNGCGLFGTAAADCSGAAGEGKGETQRFDHIFDGLAKISRYHFTGDGKVDFAVRFIDSTIYRAVKSGSIPPGPYMGSVTPPMTLRQKIGGLVSSADFDNVCVNVNQMGENSKDGGAWVATTDAPVMMEFDPHTLETKGRVKSPDSIAGLGGAELFSTAHPINAGGSTYNLFTELRPLPLPFSKNTNLVHLVRTDKNLRRTVVGSIETGGRDVVPYVHDFSITENLAIVCLWPMRSNLAATVTSDRGFMREMQWAGDKGVGTKIYVIDTSGASQEPLAEFNAPPLFAYHHINAFVAREDEEDGSGGQGDTVVVDVVGYESPDIVNGDHAYCFISNMRDPELWKKQTRDGFIYRYRLPLQDRSGGKSSSSSSSSSRSKRVLNVRPELLPAVGPTGKLFSGELPTVNPRHKGQRFRFSYVYTGFAGPDSDLDSRFRDFAIVKRDHEAAQRLARVGGAGAQVGNGENVVTATLWSSANCYPTEATFVPRPEASGDAQGAEDDGVLLSQVYDGERRETFLLVLDARDMSELARCYTGMRCPVSFHGQFADYL
jgi:carotenoid cleavage dioxygenase-like enzyme